MTTTFLKRQKEHKRHEKAKAKAEVRRNKAIARREQEQNGTATTDSDIVDVSTDAADVTERTGHDIENPA